MISLAYPIPSRSNPTLILTDEKPVWFTLFFANGKKTIRKQRITHFSQSI